MVFASEMIKPAAQKQKPFKFAEFTLTKADAQKYLYADFTKHRVHKWKDVKVALYI